MSNLQFFTCAQFLNLAVFTNKSAYAQKKNLQEVNYEYTAIDEFKVC